MIRLQLLATAFVASSGLLFAGQVPDTILASPQAIMVEHALIMVIGAWALLELIRQGKRVVNRDEFTATVGKLRDDVTALMLEERMRIDEQFKRVQDRIDQYLERPRR